MSHLTVPSSVDPEELKSFESCAISNAIECLNARLRNEGFLSGTARCRFPKLPPMVGYAATARICSSAPPMSHRCYYDRMDWRNYVASLPEPRVLVLQDSGHQPGLEAFAGEIQAAIGVAQEREFVEHCRSPFFSLPELAERIRIMSPSCDLPWLGR